MIASRGKFLPSPVAITKCPCTVGLKGLDKMALRVGKDEARGLLMSLLALPSMWLLEMSGMWNVSDG